MPTKLFTNALEAGADLSCFHAPDRKWKNYYFEDEEQDLLFLVPTFLFYGIIVVNLSWARQATFTTKDGAIHKFKDYAWNMSSNIRKSSYPKAAVIDRTAKCGRKTILLDLLVLNRLYQETSDGDRFAANHLNGNKLDCRLCNLSYGILKENNDSRYSKKVPEVKYPCKIWW